MSEVVVPDLQGMPFGQAEHLLSSLELSLQALRPGGLENEVLQCPDPASVIHHQEPRRSTPLIAGETVWVTIFAPGDGGSSGQFARMHH